MSPTLVSPDWPMPDNLFAYTTTRQGGVSEGNYAGCNVGLHVGDNEKHVAQNRLALPYAQKIQWLEQVHGERCVQLPCADIKADAAISQDANYACAVMTADCVPVLITNKQGTEVAAIHAGWQGLNNGVILRTISSMSSAASSLIAWIGPAICQRHYEVPADIANKFNGFPDHIKASRAPDHFLLDLPAIACTQLNNENISNVYQSALCTYCDPAQFYSHRRASHEKQFQTGRMVTVIGFRD